MEQLVVDRHASQRFSASRSVEVVVVIPEALRKDDRWRHQRGRPVSWDVWRRGSTFRLALLGAGVVLFHALTSVLQEHVFHLPGFADVLLLSALETLLTTLLTGGQLIAMYFMVTRSQFLEHCASVNEAHTFRTHSKREDRRCRPSDKSHADAFIGAVAEGHARTHARETYALGLQERRYRNSFRSTLTCIFHPSTVPYQLYLCAALLMSLSLFLTNNTAFLLSYAMQVVFKSSKLLCMVLVRRLWLFTVDSESDRRQGEPWRLLLRPTRTSSRSEERGAIDESRDGTVLAGDGCDPTVPGGDRRRESGEEATCSNHPPRMRVPSDLHTPSSPAASSPVTTTAITTAATHHGTSHCACVQRRSRSRASAWQWISHMSRHVNRLSSWESEVLSCIVIVVGLIVFTFAAAHDGIDTDAAVRDLNDAVNGSDMQRLLRSTSGSDPKQQETISCPSNPSCLLTLAGTMASSPELASSSVPRPVSTSSLPSASSTRPRLSLRSVVIGLSGVMVSNLLDACIYMLEEVYCFGRGHNTAGKAMSGEGCDKERGKRVGETDPQTGTPVKEATVSHPLIGVESRSRCEVNAECVEAVTHPTTIARDGEPGSTSPSLNQEQWPVRTHGRLTVTSFQPRRAYASPTEVLFFLNGFASILYMIVIAVQSLTPAGTPADHINASTASMVSRFIEQNAQNASLNNQRWYGNIQKTKSTNTDVRLAAYTELTYLVILAACSSLAGTMCLLRIVDEFNSTTAVLVTSVRKTATILISYMIYQRPFTWRHSLGLAAVMGGVCWYETARRRS